MASSSFDIGGQGHRLQEAFRNVAGWTVHSMSKVANYIAYPVAEPYRRKRLEELYQACDVFHARVQFREYDRLAHKYGPKPVVIHGHGSAMRANPSHFQREAAKRGALMVVSTLDLWLLAPESEWLPAPFDVDALMAIRRQARPDLD